MVRMRTPADAVKEIQKEDPDTCVTPYFVRQLAITGKVPCTMAGRKRLINFDMLLEYLESSVNPAKEIQQTGEIRRIEE